MSHLLKRFFIACMTRVSAFGGWLDGIGSDLVMLVSTGFTWPQLRIARELEFNLLIGGTPSEIRGALLVRLRKTPRPRAWELSELVDRHFPPRPDRSDHR